MSASESNFLTFLFKNNEEKLYEAYIHWLLTTDFYPPEDEEGFLWWLGRRAELESVIESNEIEPKLEIGLISGDGI